MVRSADMRASEFEFRHRWWVIFFLFFVAFSAYSVDPVNSGAAIATWVARRLGTARADDSYRLVFACGAILLAFAAILRTWGTAYLQAEVMRDAKVHTERLVADGPYRYVRNPLYLGNILMAVAIGLMASRIGFLVLSLGMTVFVVRLLLREEAELARDRGESYRLYCAAVPRLVPSAVPLVPPAGNPPHWGQAFRAELMAWLMALSMAAFAATMNIRIFWGVFLVAVAASWLLKRPAGKQVSSPAAQ